tara:strand:+ start:1087 stop:1278 length:192 start_codon:yes stop_codon:yes gene_type:complete
MNKLKIYVSLLLALMSVFMLGAYADATVFGTKEIESHQWACTSLVGAWFLCAFLQEYRKESNN